MKRFNLFKIKNLMFVCLSIVLLATCLIVPKNNSFARAENITSIDNSKFIYNPTYSTIYNEKIYFIDDYLDNDGCQYHFKVCSTNNYSNESYAEITIPLNFKIIDAFTVDNLFFVLSDTSISCNVIEVSCAFIVSLLLL